MSGPSRTQKEVARAAGEAVRAAIEAGAIGFHAVWILPDGEFDDAYHSADVIQMTEAVNASAFRARVTLPKG